MWYRSRAAWRRRAKPQRRYLPRLEMLEDRTVPSYLFRTFNIPGAGTAPFQGTLGGDINNLGQVVGEFTDANSVFHGFLGSSSLTFIDNPNAGTARFQGTHGYSLTDQGQVLGSYTDANYTDHGYLLSGGQYTTFDDPNAGSEGTQTVGINAAGQIVGFFVDANVVDHGFLLSGGQYTTLDDPSAGLGAGQGSEAIGTNNAGQIVGDYIDANFVRHGFLANPDPASPASRPASVNGGRANGLLPAAALTNATLANLTPGTTYFFAVTAYDTNSLESPFSGEISYTVPVLSNLARLKISPGPRGQVQITGTAPVGYGYSVLSSKDLKNWSVLGTVLADASGSFLFLDTLSPGVKANFYRVQQISP